jgi:hypothetical protein
MRDNGATDPELPLATSADHTGLMFEFSPQAVWEDVPQNIDGAWVTLTDFPEAEGTGNFEPFLRLQRDVWEAGYNTSECGNYPQNSGEYGGTKCGSDWTKTMPLNRIPVVEGPGGVFFREIRLDINEAKNTDPSPLAIDVLEVYLSETPDKNGVGCTVVNTVGGNTCDFGTNSTLIWDMDTNQDTWLLLNYAIYSGSGQGDIQILIPDDLFVSAFFGATGQDISDQCPYNPEPDADCGFYFYLWTVLGHQDSAPDDNKVECLEDELVLAYPVTLGEPQVLVCPTSDAGFEEYSVRKYPYVTVSKNAFATKDRTHDWSIEKVADPTEHTLPTGESGTSDYEVVVTYEGYTDSNWQASGTITIENPSGGGGGNKGQDAEIATLVDRIDGEIIGDDPGETFFCYENPADKAGSTVDPIGYILGPGDVLYCDYSKTYDSDPGAGELRNEAQVTLESGGLFQGFYDFDFDAATIGTELYKVVEVQDVWGACTGTGCPDPDPNTVPLGTLDAADYTPGEEILVYSGTYGGSETGPSYSRTWTCEEGDEGSHWEFPNTAEIIEPHRESSASVEVNCFGLTVTKDAYPSFTRTWLWDIDKGTTPPVWNLFNGESGTSLFTIDLTLLDVVDSDWAVEGSIYITSPEEIAVGVTNVTDFVDGIEATVDCGEAFPIDVTASSPLTCSYSTSLPSGDDRVNTATAYVGAVTFVGTAPVDFGAAVITEVDPEVNITDVDDLGNSQSFGPFTGTSQVTYQRTFECGEGGTDQGTGNIHGNTATIDETGQYAEASLEVNCYELTVTKDAAGTFDRTWEWDITKSVDDPGPFVLAHGQTVDLTYTVDLFVVSQTDDSWEVTGNIYVDNPAPMDADLASVVDEMAPSFGPIDATCPSLTVPAGGMLTCTFAFGPETSPNSNPFGDLNTATATQNVYEYNYLDPLVPTGPASPATVDYQGTASVAFSLDEEIDECVDLSDTYPGGPQGQYCAPGPYQFVYPRTIGPYPPEFCGGDTVCNTASFVTVDRLLTDFSEVCVDVTVPCPECTLTPGYWKTHNVTFWGGAPPDDAWDLAGFVTPYNIPPASGLAELTPFSYMLPDGFERVEGVDGTYFDALWTPNAGNFYFNLAFHFIAAELNLLNGAQIIGDGAVAHAAAQAFFMNPAINQDNWESFYSKADLQDWHGKLAEFNEGTNWYQCTPDAFTLYWENRIW